jgi:hypothetical protein
MNKEQIERLDALTLGLNFNLAVLNSAVKNNDNLEVYSLEHFIEIIYKDSEKIRNIFEDEIP